MFQMMSLIDYSLITSAIRLSVFSEIDVNNGCIILYASVTLVLAVAYLALRNQGSKLFHLSTSARTRLSSVTTSFCCRRYVPYCPESVRWDSYRGSCSATEDSQSPPVQMYKRICNNTCPMWTGIVVLKYRACCLMCSEMWIHNRLRDIVNVTSVALSRVV